MRSINLKITPNWLHPVIDLQFHFEKVALMRMVHCEAEHTSDQIPAEANEWTPLPEEVTARHGKGIKGQFRLQSMAFLVKNRK